MDEFGNDIKQLFYTTLRSLGLSDQGEMAEQNQTISTTTEDDHQLFCGITHFAGIFMCKSRRKRAVKSVCDGNSMPPVAQSAASDSGRATGGAPHNENKLCTPSEKEQIKQARERQKAKRRKMGGSLTDASQLENKFKPIGVVTPTKRMPREALTNTRGNIVEPFIQERDRADILSGFGDDIPLEE